jgi:hypothetical protein
MKAPPSEKKLAAKRRLSKWLETGISGASITRKEAEVFTDGLLAIADRIKGLPADFSSNHDHYLHGLPKK